MNNTPALYNLYCINLNCEKSIHTDGIQTTVIFNIENLTATHICTGCHYQLFSSMHIEIDQTLTKAGARTQRHSYDSSIH